jgi:signal transduction histidine kinase
VTLVRRTSAWKGLELVERYPADDAALVLGAPGRLKQLVLHLLANAAAATHGEGTVTVAVSATDSSAEAAVTDTGAGIPADVLPHVFEPFFSTIGGSGLGLAAAHAIAREHGGELTAEPHPVAGATFRLRLPLAPVES